MVNRVLVLTEAKAALTYNELFANAASILPTSEILGDPYYMTFLDRKRNDMAGVKSTKFSASVKSKTSNQSYTTIIDFYDIDVSEQPPKPSLSTNPCRVRCSCRAFYFWFSYANKINSALSGRDFVPYVPVKNPKRIVPPRNPKNVPGVCKHIAALVKGLKHAGEVEE